MSRGLAFQVGGFYHIYNRGTDKRHIFLSEVDYARFIALLYHANSSKPLSLRTNHRGPTSAQRWLELPRDGDPLVDLCAYCLMPNHFHLLIHERHTNGVSRFIQKLSTAYTMYFNAHHERTGVLFQGKFKAQDANNDRYLKYLIVYIHLNPISLIEPKWKESGVQDMVKATHFLESYPHSSYQEYRGIDRVERCLVTKAVLPEYFQTPKDFKDTMIDWLTYKNT